jgi:purine-nucleoside phosphorylase
MSTHIGAKAGDIAEAVLLPGDPLRAKFIAETYLKNARQYSSVRGMFGFTGEYKGKRISVQGTGMGVPSISIYVNELFRDYGVKKAIRIGTAGSIQPDLPLRSVVLAIAASTDNGANAIRLGAGKTFAPAADFGLLEKAWQIAQKLGYNARVGTVATHDLFYTEEPDEWKLWAKWGCLALEMETAELYTLAAKYQRQALAILTISDSAVTGEQTSSEDREKSFTQMMDIALETLA